MNTRMAVDEASQLQEFRETANQPQNKVVRLAAKLISYVFHPLFIPVYIIWFLLSTQAYMFALFTPGEKLITLFRFFVIYSFFPLVTVLLSKALGFLNSIYLRTQKERIIPYIASNLYYFWMCYVLRNQPEFPKEAVLLSMAIFLASCAGLLVNIYMKVSMHAMAVGILIAFVAMLGLTQATNYTLYLSIALLITGLVCTARLIVSDHTPAEIYTGLLVGILSLVVAIWADKILP